MHVEDAVAPAFHEPWGEHVHPADRGDELDLAKLSDGGVQAPVIALALFACGVLNDRNGEMCSARFLHTPAILPVGNDPEAARERPIGEPVEDGLESRAVRGGEDDE